ncbi:MAG: DUF6600 domain-containing protein [Aquabacterium sp.]
MLQRVIRFGVSQTARWIQALLVLAMAASVQAADDPPGRVGRLVEVQGTVWIFDVHQGEWTAALHNRPLTGGDRLSTDAGTFAELRIGSTTVRLDGATDLEFRRLDDDRLSMQLHQGTLALRVRSPEVAREIEVLTAEGRLLPQRPGHYRVERRNDSTRAGAWQGALQFDAPDSALDVPAGRHAEFWQQGPRRETHYNWVGQAGDAFSQWVARDDRVDDTGTSTRYVSTEMTGWEDLDRHGQWSSHVEYGAIWYPRSVANGWAPYRHGQWKWIAPWGWTWIDHAPWGFAPFHYGRWVHVGGRWCWAPGARVPRPVYAPALVAFVGHSPGVSVSVQMGGPVVGWVPLAPWEAYRPWYHSGQRHVTVINHPHLPPPGHRRGDDGRERIPANPGGRSHPWANQHAPGALTVVSTDVFKGHRSVVPVQPIDAHRHGLSNQALTPMMQAPAAPLVAAVAAQPRPAPGVMPQRERIPVPQGRAGQPPAVPSVVPSVVPSPVAQPSAMTPAAPATVVAPLPMVRPEAPRVRDEAEPVRPTPPVRAVTTLPGPAAISPAPPVVLRPPAAPPAPHQAATPQAATPQPMVPRALPPTPPVPPQAAAPQPVAPRTLPPPAPAATPPATAAPVRPTPAPRDDKDGKDRKRDDDGKARAEPPARERAEPPRDRGPRTQQQ